jgi:hypothetical protein
VKAATRPQVQGLKRSRGLDQADEQDPGRVAPGHVRQLVRAESELLVALQLREDSVRQTHLRPDDARGQGHREIPRPAEAHGAAEPQARRHGGGVRAEARALDRAARAEEPPETGRGDAEAGEREQPESRPRRGEGRGPRGKRRFPAGGPFRTDRLRRPGWLFENDRLAAGSPVVAARGAHHEGLRARRARKVDVPGTAQRPHTEGERHARRHEASDEGGPEERLLEDQTALTQGEAHEGGGPDENRAVHEVGQEPGGEGRHRDPPPLPLRRRPRRSWRSPGSISFSETRCATSARGSPPKSRSTSSPTIDRRTWSSLTVAR